MYWARAPMLASSSVAAKQVNFSLIVQPPDFCRFSDFLDAIFQFHRAPPPPYLQDLRGERAQFLCDLGPVLQLYGLWITTWQRERADRFARLRRNPRDHLVDAELRRPEFGLHPFQRATRFRVAFRNGVEQSPANESRAENGLAVSVVRIAALRPHHPAGRRTTPRALFVAATADVESPARREETVERRDQLLTRQPAVRIRAGVQSLPLSAGAGDAKHEFALAAQLFWFTEACQLIATCVTDAAATAFRRSP